MLLHGYIETISQNDDESDASHDEDNSESGSESDDGNKRRQHAKNKQRSSSRTPFSASENRFSKTSPVPLAEHFPFGGSTPQTQTHNYTHTSISVHP